jgi:hypothetical protein
MAFEDLTAVPEQWSQRSNPTDESSWHTPNTAQQHSNHASQARPSDRQLGTEVHKAMPGTSGFRAQTRTQPLMCRNHQRSAQYVITQLYIPEAAGYQLATNHWC